MASTAEILIGPDQALVTIDRIDSGKPFIAESPYIGKARTMDEVLDEGLGYATRILRLNAKTLALEDITEEVAKAWLFRTDAEFKDTDTGPLFVLTSEAYRQWNAEPEPRIDHRREYGTTHAVAGRVA